MQNAQKPKADVAETLQQGMEPVNRGTEEIKLLTFCGEGNWLDPSVCKCRLQQSPSAGFAGGFAE